MEYGTSKSQSIQRDRPSAARRYDDVLGYAPHDVVERAGRLYAGTTHAVKVRSAQQIDTFWAEYRPIEHGLVDVPLWRPASDDTLLATPERTLFLAGVGRNM